MKDAAGELAFSDSDRAAVYRAIRERRDIRRQFTGEPLSAVTLRRMLEAAHLAPSVGLSQPWDFIVVRDAATRHSIQRLVQEERAAFAGMLGDDRASLFREIKIEGIVESSLNICVTCDRTRGGAQVLGRHAIPETAAYALAETVLKDLYPESGPCSITQELILGVRRVWRSRISGWRPGRRESASAG
jgi:5,6-dimethylbenzimidazole synthase